MDTDDLELDDDFLLPHQAVQYATAAAVPQQTVAEPAPRTRADTTLNSVKGIPGPAGDRDGLSARPQVVHQSRGQPVPRGTHSELGCIGNSAVLGPCVVSLDELVPFMAGGGFSVLLKDPTGKLRGSMTSQCFQAHPRLQRGSYMQLSNVSVLHVSEGQSYACIVPENIVKTFESLEDATCHAAAVAPLQSAAPRIGQSQATCSSQGAGISARLIGSQSGLGFHERHAISQEQGQVNTRCVPPPPTSTLRQRIDQMQRVSQKPAQADPKGNSAGHRLSLSHVLRQAQPVVQPDARNACGHTPTNSTQDGGSQLFTPAAPSSVSTQPYSNALSQQNSAISVPRPVCSSLTGSMNIGTVEPAARPRKAWVHRLKADLQATPSTGSAVQLNIAQPQIAQPQVAPGQRAVQQKQGNATSTLLSKLRAQGPNHSVSGKPAGSCPALQGGPSVLGYSMPQHSAMHQQPSTHMPPQQQHSASMRQPLAPMRQQPSTFMRPPTNHQAGTQAKNQPQVQNLSKTQQVALESAGLSHSQSSIEIEI